LIVTALPLQTTRMCRSVAAPVAWLMTLLVASVAFAVSVGVPTTVGNATVYHLSVDCTTRIVGATGPPPTVPPPKSSTFAFAPESESLSPIFPAAV
jgi:hypothetical protein